MSVTLMSILRIFRFSTMP